MYIREKMIDIWKKDFTHVTSLLKEEFDEAFIFNLWILTELICLH